MNGTNKNRDQIMQEALALQSQWEQALKELTKGRHYDELTPEEQQEWDRVSLIYNEQIDKRMEEMKLI